MTGDEDPRDPAVMHLADLALARAALQREPSAIAELDRRTRREVASVMPGSAQAADVAQTMLTLLMTGGPDSEPKLAQYAGLAPLGVWLRVIAARMAARDQLQASRQVPTEPEVFDALAADGVDPETARLLHTHRVAFKSCFEAAARELSFHDRLLLRQHLLDGLGIDELGKLHGVHRATAARWLARSREKLLADTTARLRRQLGLPEDGLREVVQLIRSQLDLSLSRVLARQ